MLLPFFDFIFRPKGQRRTSSTISNGFNLAKAAFGFSPYFIAEVEEATTEEPTTEPTTEPTNNKGGFDFFSKLLAWLTELFNMFTRWVQK